MRDDGRMQARGIALVRARARVHVPCCVCECECECAVRARRPAPRGIPTRRTPECRPNRSCLLARSLARLLACVREPASSRDRSFQRFRANSARRRESLSGRKTRRKPPRDNGAHEVCLCKGLVVSCTHETKTRGVAGAET